MKYYITVLFLLMLATVTGCTTKMGGFIDKSGFAYPNSNITALGSTSTSKTKMSFILPPEWEKSDIDELYNDALKKYPGANLLINYKADTTTFFPLLPIVIWSTVELEGTAAKMVVGRKDLSGR